MQMQKVIVTVVGKDTFGIIARVGAYMAEKRINILDITQTIVSGYFNMLMIVDCSKVDLSFDDMAEGLDQIGRELGVTVKCKREEIFEAMHRI